MNDLFRLLHCATNLSISSLLRESAHGARRYAALYFTTHLVFGICRRDKAPQLATTPSHSSGIVGIVYVTRRGIRYKSTRARKRTLSPSVLLPHRALTNTPLHQHTHTLASNAVSEANGSPSQSQLAKISHPTAYRVLGNTAAFGVSAV